MKKRKKHDLAWGMGNRNVTGYVSLFREGCSTPEKVLRFRNRKHRSDLIGELQKDIKHLRHIKFYITISVEVNVYQYAYAA